MILGDPYGPLPTPTKTGYNFAGWHRKQAVQHENIINLKTLYEAGKFSDPETYIFSNVSEQGCTITTTNPTSFAYTRADITNLLEIGKEYTCSFFCDEDYAEVGFDGYNSNEERIVNDSSFIAESGMTYYLKLYTNHYSEAQSGTVSKIYYGVCVYEATDEIIDLKYLYDNGKFDSAAGTLSNIKRTTCNITVNSPSSFFYARAEITDLLEVGETYLCTFWASGSSKLCSVHIDGYDKDSNSRVQSDAYITVLPNTTYYIKLYANCSPAAVSGTVSIDYTVSLKKYKTEEFGEKIENETQNLLREEQEFIAYWEPQRYRVYFYDDDSVISSDSMYYYATQLNCGVIPKKTGYTFTGFWTEKTGGIQIIDFSGRANVDINGYTRGLRIYAHAGDLNLYAQWK